MGCEGVLWDPQAGPLELAALATDILQQPSIPHLHQFLRSLVHCDSLLGGLVSHFGQLLFSCPQSEGQLAPHHDLRRAGTTTACPTNSAQSTMRTSRGRTTLVFCFLSSFRVEISLESIMGLSRRSMRPRALPGASEPRRGVPGSLLAGFALDLRLAVGI